MPGDRANELKAVRRILIVDDDPVLRLLATERLTGEGFEVIDAGSGEEGLELFVSERPDIVLLDVEMPGMDGFATCHSIRSNPAGSHVPVLILTGRDDVPSIERAYEVGATDFVSKPLNWIVLAHRIRYMLRASKSFLDVRAQQIRLDEVQHYAGLGSWEIDLRGRKMFVSSAFRALTHLPREVVDFDAEKLFSLVVHPEDQMEMRRVIDDALCNRDGFSLEHRLRLPDGTERIVHSQAHVRMDGHDECVALDGFTQDITHRRQTEAQVRVLAFKDSLTGLANRTAFKLHIANAIARSERKGELLAVLYLDLDQFKRINDTFGHTAGDQLLQAIAKELDRSVRGEDVASRSETPAGEVMISRLGGDEFTVLLEGLVDESDAGRVAQRVLDALNRPVFIEGHEVRVTSSVGIALWPHDGADVDTLLRNADAAMYHAKQRGRANFQFYQKSLNSHALERIELEANLCRAIEDEELVVHFQPKLDLRTGEIMSCEALARWRDFSRGDVAPSSFVPLAESSGLIADLGEAVLRLACRGARGFQEILSDRFGLAVNLSVGQIKSDSLLEMIDEVLLETGFDPTLLEFEVTESALIHDEQRTLRVLQAIRDRGCRISLDDFGTGYSSLTNLKRFPIQTIKIDQSFVAGIGRSTEDEAITAAVLSMASQIGIHVVAEGVETEEQLAFLQERGCDEVQGFLVSRALEPAALPAFVLRYTERQAIGVDRKRAGGSDEPRR